MSFSFKYLVGGLSMDPWERKQVSGDLERENSRFKHCLFGVMSFGDI